PKDKENGFSSSVFVTLLQTSIIQQVYSNPAIGFSVQLSRDAFLGDGQAIKYDKIITNYGNSYNKWTGHFVAPKKGLYLFSCSIMADHTGHIHVQIVKNGTKISTIYSNLSSYDQSSQTVVLALRRGDSVWTRQSLFGRRLHDHLGYNMFTGILISRNILKRSLQAVIYYCIKKLVFKVEGTR
ncbi:complement C1q tumor necrosis factor-related protein 3-like, partial [Saccostrea cucullata]|uniref:complement C1q tumor necrosis factor-related protein 3-like n=1 Tax=Saccostrea cuccullata TaxID=36930 RepID=UPI002ED39E98